MDIVAMFSLYFPQTFAEIRKINTDQWARLAAHFCNSNKNKHPQRRWAGAFISEKYLLVLHYYCSLKCNHPSKCICWNFKMYLSKIQNSICICINFEGKHLLVLHDHPLELRECNHPSKVVEREILGASKSKAQGLRNPLKLFHENFHWS